MLQPRSEAMNDIGFGYQKCFMISFGGNKTCLVSVFNANDKDFNHFVSVYNRL